MTLDDYWFNKKRDERFMPLPTTRIGGQPGINAYDLACFAIMLDWNAGARVCHQLNVNAGWWSDLETGQRLRPEERDIGEIFALIHSEISEGLEGWRKNLMDDKLLHREMLEVELADACIRILDVAGAFEWDLSTGALLYHTEMPDSVGKCFAHLHRKISGAFTQYETWVRQGVLGPAPSSETPGYQLGRVLAMIEQLAESRGYNLKDAMLEKIVFNLDRADHKREHRLAEGGKKC